jgi:hypothetical protein
VEQAQMKIVLPDIHTVITSAKLLSFHTRLSASIGLADQAAEDTWSMAAL